MFENQNSVQFSFRHFGGRWQLSLQQQVGRC
jgi:hypothetical protein